MKIKRAHSLRYLLWGFLCVFTISLYLHLDEAKWLEKQQIKIKMSSLTDNHTNRTAIEKNVPTLQNKSKVVVLVYTRFGKKEKWIKDSGSCYNMNHTESKNCLFLHTFDITYDKQRFAESDLVVFHARDMPTLRHLKALLKERPMPQRWVFSLWESPNHFSYTKPFHGLFNLTWTYRRDSDIWGPYGSYIQLRSKDPIAGRQKRPPSDFTRGKSKIVAWIVSNCKAKLRLKFVRELKKFIKVDVFGKCSGRVFGESRACPKTKQSKFDCLKKYKFYLSFENSLCEDYITEKYWDNLGEANVIPVVMGGADYTKLAIPGSYINVLDFKSVEQLAEYLHYLNRNDTAYNEYFKWRQKYQVLTAGIGMTLCNICQWFASKFSRETKVYHDLTEYWVQKGRCGTKNHLVLSMINK